MRGTDAEYSLARPLSIPALLTEARDGRGAGDFPIRHPTSGGEAHTVPRAAANKERHGCSAGSGGMPHAMPHHRSCTRWHRRKQAYSPYLCVRRDAPPEGGGGGLCNTCVAMARAARVTAREGRMVGAVCVARGLATHFVFDWHENDTYFFANFCGTAAARTRREAGPACS
jgi:hypothetical protein